jgi:pentatricopeptide repeat domain-containing protein 1
MKQSGIAPNVYTYNALISVMELSGQWETAMAAFEEMKSNAIVPNENTFIVLISAMQKGGQWEKTVSLFEEMKANGIAPSFDVILEKLDTQTRGGGTPVARIEEELAYLKRGGEWRMDDKLVTSLMGKANKSRGWRHSLALFEAMKEKSGRPLNVFLYSAAVTACNKGRQWQKSQALIDEMRRAGITPNEKTYGARISGIKKGQEMDGSRYKPSRHNDEMGGGYDFTHNQDFQEDDEAGGSAGVDTQRQTRPSPRGQRLGGGRCTRATTTPLVVNFKTSTTPKCTL